ncbi:MAG: phosphoribosylpyrophosphate synthetase [Faunusvirus sp.]|jgi:ribose-phosphate pyrophosphokinase|uniref:ribose-phosphate diphosphokinase n=1 Tax=Faunusvirus sp. TaxID=2487766 RepID=A0A3G5A2U6_9VIRU|nr:MAG: phosphoribosylpyrophosphate synthetase [Faunusvirus sp.]
MSDHLTMFAAMAHIAKSVETKGSDLKSKIALVAGESNPVLFDKIANRLNLNLTATDFTQFSNGEFNGKLNESIRDKQIYILQTCGADYKSKSVNDYFVQLLLMVNACKLSGGRRITVIIPTFPYSRSDKRDHRGSIGAQMAFTALSALGVKRFISMDLHSGQLQGFSKETIDNLFCKNIFIEYLTNSVFVDDKKNKLTIDEINKKYILVAPDLGSSKRIEAYAKQLNMNHTLMNKHRDYTTKNRVESTIIIDHECIYDKTVILIDDMVDTMGTMVAATNTLMKHKARDVIIIATHGVLSGPAISRINETKDIIKVIVSNSIPQDERQGKCDKLEVVDTSALFAEVIERLHSGTSISELFD